MKKVCLTPAGYAEYLAAVSEKIALEQEYITALDAATGDGDHWANMNAGFSRLAEEKDKLAAMSFRELFSKCAMTVMSGVGGSSGVLYGSAYLSAAKAVGQAKHMDAALLADVLQAELEAIMTRGNGKPGYKTMIDPLYQSVTLMRAALPQGDEAAVAAMRQGAKEGMEATRDMEAVRGRACYQANKGVGHLDPGAVTMYYLLDLLGEAALASLS